MADRINYTKGEWKAHRILGIDELYFSYVKSGETHIARVDNKVEEICKANAQLIASAPLLYEACTEALSLIKPYTEGYGKLNLANQAYDKLKQALAKVGEE